jgi:hypothetical protein
VTARELVFDYLRDGQRRGFVQGDLPAAPRRCATAMPAGRAAPVAWR